MTTPSTGPISMGDINTELGLSSTARVSLDDTSVRQLLGKGTAQSTISLADARGKSNAFSFSFSGNAINLYNYAISVGWNGSSAIIATMNNHVYSTSTGSPALYISGFPAQVTLYLNGFVIQGAGGAGGNGAGAANVGGNGGVGGTGLVVTATNSGGVRIDNSNAILGGGGGGGGGGSRFVSGPIGGRAYAGGGVLVGGATGGGGGGGAGYGAAGAPYASSSGGSFTGSFGAAGGLVTGGLGGAGGWGTGWQAGAGGSGGSYAGAGANGVAGSAGGTSAGAPGAGGGGGAAVNGYNYVTWSGSGSFYGPTS